MKFLSAAFYACALFACLSLPGETTRPNVLFIAIDDLKPMLGAYGDTTIQTPQMDRLAQSGTLFLNNHCQEPICGPSRASLLTGQRPNTTKVNDLKTKMRDIQPDLITLPQHFKNNGYTTVGTGKIFDPRCVDGRQFQDKPSWSVPFTYYYGKLPSAAGFVNPDTIEWFKAQKNAKGETIPEWNVKGVPATEGTEDVADNAYSDGAMADAAVGLIKKYAAEDQPFFLAVGFQKPHLPFIAPKKYWDMYDRDAFELAEYQQAPDGTPDFTLQPGWELRGKYDVPKRGPLPDDLQRELIHGYHACVSYIDAQVGKLLDALETAGIADNTIVVLWGDHGWHLGDHSMWCKHSVYEQATRSPLIIFSPMQKDKAGRVAAPTEFIDIYPTLCELAGLEQPEALEGVSLAPLLDDDSGSVRDVAMSQHYRSPNGEKLTGYSFRGPRFRYTVWRENQPGKPLGSGPVVARELYDYELDPLETKNLVDNPDYATVVSQMETSAAKELARYGIH
ncbi:sulfatase [Cerasicoccus fimbriatus]|uniref:sulfatase n=1 Tax=Cerasicoccus fimbriatus TaxID=3014554 RepID=UPI0022B59E4E|nr:sulfatase [Cerasicoccus sp. TK19100]